MPEHHRRQPLSRGFSLVELIVAAATAALIALVSAMLFKAAFVTYVYTVNQSAALAAARGAISGDGSRLGLLWETQSSDAVSALTADELTAVASTDTIRFHLSDGDLYKTRAGVTTKLADDVDSLAINYYNVNASGLVVESTAANSASLVTALVTMRGNGANDKTYRFYSGARLRNHP